MKIPTLFQSRGEVKHPPATIAPAAGTRNTRSHPPKRRKLSEEYLQKLDAHDKVWLGRRTQLHTLFTLNPAYLFQAHETYSAQLHQHFNTVIGTKLTVEAVREWEAKLTEADVVVVPQSSNPRKEAQERKITDVLAEMRSNQLYYLGILYYESLRRQKACAPHNVDTKEAFEDAMKVIRCNIMVFAILEADQQSSVLHLDNMEKLQNKLENCIVASMSTGLSQFDTLC